MSYWTCFFCNQDNQENMLRCPHCGGARHESEESNPTEDGYWLNGGDYFRPLPIVAQADELIVGAYYPTTYTTDNTNSWKTD